MTATREWTEELVAQYYELQEYIVLRNVPTTTGSGGGRYEADVVAFRTSGTGVELLDIEIGTYYESAKEIAKKLKRKFTDSRRAALLNQVKKRLGTTKRGVTYQSVFVDAAWLTDKVLAEVREQLTSDGIEVRTLQSIVKDIPQKVDAWRESNKTERGTPPSVPRSLDLIHLTHLCSWVWEK